MPPVKKMNRSTGYDDLTDEQLGLNQAPLFAPMPSSIANNSFNLAQATTTATPTMSNQPGPSSGNASGTDSLFAFLNSKANTSTGGIGGGGLFPSDPSKRKNNIDLAEDFFAKRLSESRGGSRPEGAAGSDGQRLTDNSSSQQQQNQAPSTAGGLFGNTPAQPANQASGGGGLFGASQQSQPANQASGGGGLFGAPQQSQPQQSGGLFGSTNQQQQPSGGLFGSTNTQQQSQPQQSGGLFGNLNTQQQNQSSNTGSLFGGNNAPQPNQPSGLGGLFGGGAATQQQPQNSGGLFGGANPQPKPSVFAGAGSGLGNSSTLGTGSNMFAKPAQPASAGNLFASTANAGQSQPSLLGATQHSRLNQSAPFGRLSMGQNAAPANTVGAVKIDLENMRPTTRFDDCVDDVKQQLEQIDKWIQDQERNCKLIEAFCPKHGEDVNSIAPDVEYVRSKADDADQALISDAQGVDAQRRNTDKDTKDLERCQRIVTNLNLPQAYQYSGSMSLGGMGALGSMYGSQQRPQQTATVPDGEDPSNYDMDLIGNYFAPMAGELQKTVDDYAKTLTEIESHMRVMESSAMAQAQQLAQQRSGMGGAGSQQSSEENVRELADTLRGFEQSILGVAGVVGECREGVNELVLGRLGGNL